MHKVCRRGARGNFFFLGGGRGVVAGMKNLKHILMGHEIFLKIFDGPQNISLCSPLVILIFK